MVSILSIFSLNKDVDFNIEKSIEVTRCSCVVNNKNTKLVTFKIYFIAVLEY